MSGSRARDRLLNRLPTDLISRGASVWSNACLVISIQIVWSLRVRLHLPRPEPRLAVSRTILLRSSLLMEKSPGLSWW